MLVKRIGDATPPARTDNAIAPVWNGVVLSEILGLWVFSRKKGELYLSKK